MPGSEFAKMEAAKAPFDRITVYSLSKISSKDFGSCCEAPAVIIAVRSLVKAVNMKNPLVHIVQRRILEE